LQLRGGLDLRRAAEIVPYLSALGIEHAYLSPVCAASPGSEHGYDVLDPTRIDSDIGGREAFDELCAALARAGMGVLLDIVPNHMRAHADNRWWRDVLEHGPASRFADFFDLRWRADPERRLVLPVLGSHYGEVLEAGELVPARDRAGFVIRYHQTIAPLDPRTWAVVLDRAAALARDPTPLSELARRCEGLPPRHATEDARARRATVTSELRDRLARLAQDEATSEAIDGALAELAGRPGDPDSFDALHTLLDDQPWRLAYWRSGLGELNYRRFFDVSELVALRTELPTVFDATHRLVAELVRAKAIAGLRVDHVDGLADPRGYLERVRALGVEWLVVEKILCGDEALRSDWQADGTTGYEFANAAVRVFLDADGAALLDSAWRVRGGADLAAWTHAAKLQVLDELFAPTLRRLAEDLRGLTVSDRRARDVAQGELEAPLRELTAALPVYRTYLDGTGAGELDDRVLATAVAEAERHLAPDHRLALSFIVRVLRGEPGWTEDRQADVCDFVRRWQQLTGPVMAKGVEDTLMYRWVPLLCLAEVGSDLRVPVDPVAELHELLRRSRATQRAGLVATATHDTKRGEDVRMRICVLSELAERWLACTRPARAALRDVAPEAPADDDEVELLLQTVVGAWPDTPAAEAELAPRLREYVLKAAREAKRRTKWLQPDEVYERAVQARADAIIDAMTTTEWGRDLAALQRRVAFHGAMNGLGQVVLKVVAPGVCDVYQGTELWDLSLVDPDNRRPVDFAARERLHAELVVSFAADPLATIAALRERWSDGRIKMAVLMRGLVARRSHPELFLHGDVQRIGVAGPRARHICAVLRTHEGESAMGVVARTTTALVEPPTWPIGSVWELTSLVVPHGGPTRWRDALTGAEIEAVDGRLRLVDVLRELPCALLVAG